MTNPDLTQMAKEAIAAQTAEGTTQETTEKQPSLSEQMSGLAAAQQAMAANPDKVTVTTVTDFEGVKVGAPATKENLEAIKKGGELQYPSAEEYFEGANRGPSDLVKPQKAENTDEAAPELTKPTLPARAETPTDEVGPAPNKTYDGPGMVVENVKQSSTDTRIKDELPPEMQEEIDAYIENMEEDFNSPEAREMRATMVHVDPTIASREEITELLPEAAEFAANRFGQTTMTEEQLAELRGEEEVGEDGLTPSQRAKQRVEDFEKAVVVIDKINAGNLEFTDEEHKKLERVNKIRVEEVEVVQLSQIKRRRSKPGSVEKLLKRTPTSIRTTNVVLPASGYVATVAGCTPHELMTLQADNQNNLLREQTIWSTIHSKVTDTSIGKMDFDKFMENTASVDQDVFIYGILQSTFPDDDSITLRCQNPECVDKKGNPKEYEHKYSVRSLLRVEELSEETQARIASYIDASVSSEQALLAHDEAPVMQSLAIRLPESGIVLELQLKSAYDYMEVLRSSLNNNLDSKYAQAAAMATTINVALLPPAEGEEEYSEIYDFAELTQVVYALSNKDYLLFTHKAMDFNKETSFNFGFIDVNCPHCGEVTEVLDLPISDILFYRHSQAINTEVE